MSIKISGPVPGPRSRALMDQRQKYVARGPFHATPIFVKSASGAHVEDVDGNVFLDFASGIGVVNTGHCHPALVRAVQEQSKKFLHTSFNVAPYESYIEVARLLAELTPGNFEKKTLLVNSGAEAVENAVKIARVATGKKYIVAFEHGYHGRTYMAMALTAKDKPYKEGFGPFCGEVIRSPFPYAYRWPTSNNDISTEAFASFKKSILEKTSFSEVAAVIIEPVLGEGGFVPAPVAFLRMLQDFCKQHNIVLIADEIQTGFGRTGTTFASEQLNFVPDLITLAKGLGGGLPIAAVVGRANLMDAGPEGSLGGTYGGNPLACAAALEVLKLFSEEPCDLLTRARSIGEALEGKMKSWTERFETVGEARGLGPMRALELVRNRGTKEPDAASAKALIKHGYENGVLLIGAGTFGNVLRFLVPLTISPVDLNEGLEVIEAGLRKIS